MAPPQEGDQCGSPAGSVLIWVVTVLLLLAVLGGGGCLVAYVMLPPSEAPGWIPCVGLGLVALPWAFWLATVAYRCVTARSADRAVAPAAAAGS
ncbi:hypothetical protein CFC21_052938 [Triticum aestivum]|uniref:Uncharacterized protein n=2 Tax=Triticum aestivum TaxID=4565 RepID=A0A9R1GAQ8_WHEAT|nr:uncharacterized protein LOC119289032 [Triticum dicoccoides]XP_044360496.1 uncharacterized protein LOC123082173 [Triticum aestivum]KAF7043604.1 hypothetical protein CFC21_052935 [Triticum aestivum]KAF7043607.1 hypothetical protein CFC21_052938 [Triticum aestivum]